MRDVSFALDFTALQNEKWLTSVFGFHILSAFSLKQHVQFFGRRCAKSFELSMQKSGIGHNVQRLNSAELWPAKEKTCGQSIVGFLMHFEQ